MQRHDVAVIGASAGGLEALKKVLECLPERLPIAFFVALHMPAGERSHLPQILQQHSPHPAEFATDGATVEPGRILVAPPDQHLIVKEGFVRLSHGPRENFWRPSVDVLFRSAAVAYGPRVIGVVLSGALDDGTAGLSAIVRCGGVIIAQDPDEAGYPEMPESAVRNVPGTRVLPACEIATALQTLASQPVAVAPPEPPAELRLEVRIAEGNAEAARESEHVGESTSHTCPECNGPLREAPDDVLRFRCHVGHAYTASSLINGTREKIEASLWTAVRLLQQRSNLSRTSAARERERGRLKSADSYEKRAGESESQAAVLHELLLNLSL
jgi:two-component system chemotaxis response regulator CheB